MSETSIMPAGQSPVGPDENISTPYKHTYGEADQGYLADPSFNAEDFNNQFAPPTMKEFKGEDLQRANNSLAAEGIAGLIQTPPELEAQLDEARRQDIVARQQRNARNTSGFLGASNAHLQAARHGLPGNMIPQATETPDQVASTAADIAAKQLSE